MSNTSPFFAALLDQYGSWKQLPIVERAGQGWRGLALTVPPPLESNLAYALDIEELPGEITIGFDYCHVHVKWPLNLMDTTDNLWSDPLAIIDAILNEKVLSLSGWVDEKLKIGSLCETDKVTEFFIPKLQRLRIRSWKGTFDRDEVLSNIANDKDVVSHNT